MRIKQLVKAYITKEEIQADPHLWKMNTRKYLEKMFNCKLQTLSYKTDNFDNVKIRYEVMEKQQEQV